MRIFVTIFLCNVHSVVYVLDNHLKKKLSMRVKTLVYIVTYIHIVNKFCYCPAYDGIIGAKAV